MESTQYLSFAHEVTDLDKSKEQPNKSTHREIGIGLNDNLLKICSPPPLFSIKRKEGQTFCLLLPTTKHANFWKAFQHTGKALFAKRSHWQHFSSFIISKLAYAYVRMNFLACIQRIPRAQPKNSWGHRNSTATFPLKVLPSAEPAGEMLHHKPLPNSPALPAHAPAPRRPHAASSAFPQPALLSPSQNTLHLPASGRIKC